MRNLPDIAESLLPIVERAGAAIMRIYDGAITVQHKVDDSPLTLADLESQRVIVDGLTRQWPRHPHSFGGVGARPLERTPGLARAMGGRPARWNPRVHQAQRRIHHQYRPHRRARAGARGGGRARAGTLVLGCSRHRRIHPPPGRGAIPDTGRAARGPDPRGRQPLAHEPTDRRISGAARPPCAHRNRQLAQILSGGAGQRRFVSALRTHLGMGYRGGSGGARSRGRPRHPRGRASSALQLPGRSDQRRLPGVRPLKRTFKHAA